MIIEYDGSVTSEIKKIVKVKVDNVAHLLPVWCNKLIVFWEPHDKDGNTHASCEPMYEYRQVGLTLYPLFIESDTWRETLVHEIHHAILRPLTSKIDKIIEKLVKDETMTEWLMSDLADAEEAVCEDLTIFRRKILGG